MYANKTLSERILLEILEDDLEKQGSLYIPDTAKENHKRQGYCSRPRKI